MKSISRRLPLLLAPVILLALITGWCAWSYDRALAITTPNGISWSGYVRIGGIDQWLQIRGEDKANPVLLWLNGGPGYSTIPQTLSHREWEKYFTVVMWDQRGEGRTLEESGTDIAPTMNIPRMTADGVEVADYLRQRLGKHGIVLLGHSWGSILGVEMARRRPDLFSIYVGTGQVTKLSDDLKASYPLLIEQARIRDNRNALAELQAVGPPPYTDPEKYFPLLKWANTFDPAIRRPVSAAGLWAMGKMMLAPRSRGPDFSQRLLLPAMLDDDLTAGRLDMPVVIIEGDKDLVVSRAKRFFDTVDAPRKRYVSLPGAGHLALLTDPSRFLKALVTEVRPLAN